MDKFGKLGKPDYAGSGSFSKALGIRDDIT